MILKCGDYKIPHFAHRPSEETCVYSKPESELHLLMKATLRDFLPGAELEVARTDRLGRTTYFDVVSAGCAWECQVSSMDLREWQERENCATANHLRLVWILGWPPYGKLIEDGWRKYATPLRLERAIARTANWRSPEGLAADPDPPPPLDFYDSGCWHCAGSNACSCIACAQIEGRETKPGPCSACQARQAADHAMRPLYYFHAETRQFRKRQLEEPKYACGPQDYCVTRWFFKDFLVGNCIEEIKNLDKT
jgi:hypothetical protein